jgi:uncharacterized protein DUF1269/heat induced stress protein YflT
MRDQEPTSEPTNQATDEPENQDIPEHERNSVVGVYGPHEAADEAVRALRDAGVEPRRISVIGRGMHSEERVVGFFDSGRRMMHWGGYGALWGGLWGWLVFGFFWVPGIGHLTAAGWIAWNLASAAGGAAVGGGLGAVAAALTSVGVPDDMVPQYESALRADRYLIIVHGSPDDVDRARAVLQNTQTERLDTYVKSPST